MSDPKYKGYWMVTNRCNLNCSYCVLEDAPDQLKRELDLEGKKALVTHLYENLHFRRLTLSGGEVVIFGKRAPSGFIELLDHIRKYRSSDPMKNLGIELYTNGTFINEKVLEAMDGVVDLVAVTIDGAQDQFLTQIGRNNQKFSNYFERIVRVCKALAKLGIELKLHSVISAKNHAKLPEELTFILDAIENAGGKVSKWKFYQYMSYDDACTDEAHAISEETYLAFTEKAIERLSHRIPVLHFKDNQEMNASLFNILSYGNAQYMLDGDTWTTSGRTKDLRDYSSMEELFAEHQIDPKRFKQFHEITSC